MSTGRYFVVTPSGRRFCVEPISGRDQKIDDHVFTNGGVSGAGVKNAQLGGSIRAEDSIVTPENGFARAVTLPPGVSPNGFIDALCACRTAAEEEALWGRYG